MNIYTSCLLFCLFVFTGSIQIKCNTACFHNFIYCQDKKNTESRHYTILGCTLSLCSSPSHQNHSAAKHVLSIPQCFPSATPKPVPKISQDSLLHRTSFNINSQTWHISQMTFYYYLTQNFQKGTVSLFTIRTGEILNPISYISIWHDSDGQDLDWFLDKVKISDPLTDKK